MAVNITWRIVDPMFNSMLDIALVDDVKAQIGVGGVTYAQATVYMLPHTTLLYITRTYYYSR